MLFVCGIRGSFFISLSSGGIEIPVARKSGREIDGEGVPSDCDERHVLIMIRCFSDWGRSCTTERPNGDSLFKKSLSVCPLVARIARVIKVALDFTIGILTLSLVHCGVAAWILPYSCWSSCSYSMGACIPLPWSLSG